MRKQFSFLDISKLAYDANGAEARNRLRTIITGLVEKAGPGSAFSGVKRIIVSASFGMLTSFYGMHDPEPSEWFTLNAVRVKTADAVEWISLGETEITRLDDTLDEGGFGARDLRSALSGRPSSASLDALHLALDEPEPLPKFTVRTQ